MGISSDIAVFLVGFYRLQCFSGFSRGCLTQLGCL